MAGTLPRARGGDCGGVGERWVKAIEVPVQTAEAARDNGEGAAGAAGTGGADYRVSLGVFEAEEVDCFFLLLLWRIALFVFTFWSGTNAFEPVSDGEGEMEGRGIALLDEHGEFAEEAAPTVGRAWAGAEGSAGDAIPVGW